MNIAFFSESYKPYLSGVTNSIETLKAGLEERGHRVIVFSPDYPGAKKSKDVHRFPSLPAPYPGYRLSIPFFLDAQKILRSHRIDIIHTHSPYQLGLVAMRCARKLDVPLVFTMHTVLGKYMHYVPLVPEKLSDLVSSSYIRWFCNNCDAVIAPTQVSASALVDDGVWGNIEIVPSGVDLSRFKGLKGREVRKEHGIPAKAGVLLFVGRLAREKNLPFLFKAFRRVIAKRDDVRLLIAAGGPMKSELKKIAPKNTIFAGQIGYPQVIDYYDAADVFVFSSLTETQGLVLVEAMAGGLPQVAVSAEGVADVVVDGVTGYLTPLSERTFAEKVLKLLGDETLYRRMSRASKTQARTVYSKEVFAAKIEHIYKSVL